MLLSNLEILTENVVGHVAVKMRKIVSQKLFFRKNAYKFYLYLKQYRHKVRNDEHQSFFLVKLLDSL